MPQLRKLPQLPKQKPDIYQIFTKKTRASKGHGFFPTQAPAKTLPSGSETLYLIRHA